MQKKLAESIAKQAEQEDLLNEADNDKRGFWAKVWGRINPFASGKTKMLNLASDNKEVFIDVMNKSIEREKQYQQMLIDKIKQLESQHFEINDPEPWRNNGYNGKGNDGTIIKQHRTTGTHQATEKSARLVSRQRGQLQPRNASDRLKPSASRSRQPIASRLRPTN